MRLAVGERYFTSANAAARRRCSFVVGFSAVLAGLLCAAVALVGCGSGSPPPGAAYGLYLRHTAAQGPGSTGGSGPGPEEPYRFFSPSSIWNMPVRADSPVDPTSPAVIPAFAALIAGEQQAGNGPWINTTDYSVPVYTVTKHEPTVTVRLENHRAEPTLSAAWRNVPLPVDAQPSAGTDGDLVVWQPSTNRMWEFWRLVRDATGWHASWGGVMRKVSQNPGVFGDGAYPGARPWWGVSASSLPLVGGLITLEDIEHGNINHALAIAIPGVRAGLYTSPAQRDDGTSPEPLALPEGAHLRLNPKLDLSTLNLPPLTLMIAKAAQRYGIFVRDKSSVVQFFAQDPTPLGKDPYAGERGYFEGKYPNQLLASFPWNELELLKMSLHPSGFSRRQVHQLRMG